MPHIVRLFLCANLGDRLGPTDLRTCIRLCDTINELSLALEGLPSGLVLGSTVETQTTLEYKGAIPHEAYHLDSLFCMGHQFG